MNFGGQMLSQQGDPFANPLSVIGVKRGFTHALRQPRKRNTANLQAIVADRKLIH
jgi:hypothetical protein